MENEIIETVLKEIPDQIKNDSLAECRQKKV